MVPDVTGAFSPRVVGSIPTGPTDRRVHAPHPYYAQVIRYQERSPSRRAWLILLGLCAAAWIGLFLVDTSSPWMPTTIVGMLAVIAAIAMWSTGRYGNITLTDTVLRVGRASALTVVFGVLVFALAALQLRLFRGREAA